MSVSLLSECMGPFRENDDDHFLVHRVKTFDSLFGFALCKCEPLGACFRVKSLVESSRVIVTDNCVASSGLR